ncbi:hypothetical protein D3C83_113110 [compost metagenome]
MELRARLTRTHAHRDPVACDGKERALRGFVPDLADEFGEHLAAGGGDAVAATKIGRHARGLEPRIGVGFEEVGPVFVPAQIGEVHQCG